MYRTLNSAKIVATLVVLQRRITERFPSASLAKVCAELTQIARESAERTRLLAEPNYTLRAISIGIVICGIAMIAVITTLLKVRSDTGTVYDVLQGVDAGLNIVILMGAAVIFLITLEGRWKRQQALGDLDELRSIIHVIDMHQLTKDPAASASISGPTQSSPARLLTPAELVRYLDYCSEILSLAAKVAAVYAQSSKDPQVVEAASDLQQITANLSAKIWQKIEIAQREIPRSPPPQAPPRSPAQANTFPEPQPAAEAGA